MQPTDSQQAFLLSLAKHSIQNAWHQDSIPTPKTDISTLEENGACFVTLNKANQLRGCIGSLEAHRHLLEDIQHNAFAAAFRDPRFAPLLENETEQLEIEISILSKPEAMENCHNLENLLEQLRPFKDGLILGDGMRRATFLPAVWEQLPNKEEFVAHLLRKAGIPVWNDQIQCQRYTSFQFGAKWQDID